MCQKGRWKSVLMKHGEQYVTKTGQKKMPELFAHNSDLFVQVKSYIGVAIFPLLSTTYIITLKVL